MTPSAFLALVYQGVWYGAH